MIIAKSLEDVLCIKISFYKPRNKTKVTVITPLGNATTEVCCLEGDKFDPVVGVGLCLEKLFSKIKNHVDVLKHYVGLTEIQRAKLFIGFYFDNPVEVEKEIKELYNTEGDSVSGIYDVYE